MDPEVGGRGVFRGGCTILHPAALAGGFRVGLQVLRAVLRRRLTLLDLLAQAQQAEELLGVKLPAAQTPRAWPLRTPGWLPLSCSNTSMKPVAEWFQRLR
ncbi:hypothetical protein [Haliea sp.]